MAIAYRSGSSAGDASGTNLTVSKPTGTADGDILIACLYREAGTWTLPAGWTQWGSDQRDSANNIYLTVAWKRASSEPSSWTFNLSTTTWRTIAIAAYSGALESGDPIDVGPTGNNGSINAVSAASITTATANAMRIVVKADYFSSDVAVGSSGMTKGISYGGCQHFYLIQASAGSSGTKTFGEAGTPYWATFHLAIKPATGAGSQNISPNLLTNSSSFYSPTISPQPVTISANLLTNNNSIFSPTVSLQSVTIVPNLLTNTNTIYSPVVSAGGINIVPDVISNTEQIYSPTLLPQPVSILPNLLDNTNTFYDAQLNLNINTNLIAPTNEVFAASLGTGVVNWNIEVGEGYSDVSPKQLVRTSSNYLYTVAPNCDSYPDYSANGLTQTIRVHKANNIGIPTGFTRQDSSNEPAAINGCAAALDSDDNIRIVWAARNTSSNTRYLRYAVFNTSTDTWGSVTTIASDLDYDDWGQGDQSVAVAVDASDVVHVVYLGTAGDGSIYNRRIYYRNNSGGTWSSATQIDNDVSHTSNLLAWHPSIAFDDSGNIVVSYLIGGWYESQNAIIYSRIYSGGSWGSSVQASAAGDNVACSIDQSSGILITPDGTYHLAYMLYSTTNSQKYIRYRYSTNNGSTWNSNNPTNQASHNPSLGWTGSKVRIIAHGTPDGSNHGENLYYFEGDGGSATWGSWTQFVTGTNYDSSVNTRWSQFNHNYPNTFDIIYWDDAYPNVLYAGSQIFSLDVAPSALTNTNTFYDATLSSTTSIAPDLLTNTTVFYDATLTTGTIDIVPDVLTNSNTVYAPTILINVDANLLINSNTIHTPTVDVGAVTITTDLLTNTSVIFSPVVGGSIVVDNLVNSQVFYDPTISTGAVTIAVDAITNTSAVFAPTVNAGATTITPDLLNNSTAFYGPTISVGSTNVDMELLGSANVIYSPIVNSGQIAIVPELLASNSVIYDPTLSTGAVNVDANLLSNTNTVYGPTITAGSVNINANVLTNTSVLFSPVVNSGGITIVPDTLESNNTFYDIIVSAGAVNITTDLLENTNQVFAPDVVQSVETDLLENISQVFSPSLTQIVSTQILDNTSSVYSPEITTGAVNIQTDRVESTTQFHSPWVYIGGATTLTADLLVNTSVFYNPTLVDRYGRINRVSATSRTNELSSTTREYDILVN